MVFGFFSRKPAQPQASVESIPAGPLDSAAENSHQLHTPSPSIDYHQLHQPTPPPVPPPDTPSPPPEQLITDPTDLLSLISSVPSQTLHAFTLTHLQDTPPPALTALTSFFSALTPPPRLHCVRCHKSYFELENTDRSCLVPHDDDSAVVDRVRSGIGSSTEYETLFGCCSRTVEGDGDMGPPDGWCYEGKHTVDPKRARFRADSTPHDDKLTTCAQMRCFAPPATAKRARSTRKRARKDVEEGEEEEDNASVGSSVSKGAISSKSNPTRAIKKPRKNTQTNNPPTDPDAMDVDAPSTSISTPAPRPNTPPTSPRRKPSTPKPKSSASSSSTRVPINKSPLSASFTAAASPTPTPSRQIVSVEVPLKTPHQRISKKKVCEKEEMEESSGGEQGGKAEEGKVVYVTKSKSKASPAAPLTRKSSVASLKHKASVKSPLKPRSSTGSLKPKSKSTAMQPPDVEKAEGEEGKPVLRTRASRKQLAEVVDTSVDGEGEVWARMRTRSGNE
ncbi:uncharacterized protein LACBIDRAFT_292706 [Laccaria bicolor S238N-H82]|uniref:Predicted protein n=1 Tax=Laccaria bicolor (strain S238N-H82 / ATCC MYA-4686) TaxID=486041 RepID=B0CZS6_LACBS|nr:uncharacterized protein LACBIDRAFT_292706 [Laccaria bicolor S238N-H82]EDR12204.1 predicted protein [Laccaria bicolor S238N-H82]|eukprot:XP_001876468.1 predicted protein [Laccaria bicolor S238N-H82]